MSASHVVDMDRWRAKSRGPRTPAPGVPDAGAGAVAHPPAPATVLSLPVAPSQERYPGQVGPASVFGPVMAFGLRPSSAAASAAAAPAPAPAPAPAACGDADPSPVTSWSRGPRPRHLLDSRGTSRGPRR